VRPAGSVTAVSDFDRHEREHWTARAGVYQRTFALLTGHTAELVLDAAGVRAGTSVLDVGTGPGTLAALAAARGAKVTAVDPEPSMVSAASRLIPEVRLGALPELPFGAGEFDAVVANFVLNHVGEPAAGVRELARVAVPGGRVAATVWPAPAPPLQQLWSDALAASGVVPAISVPRLDPANDFPRTVDGFAELLGGALAGVQVEQVDWTHRVDPDDWWEGSRNGIGGFGLILQSLSPAEQSRVRAAYDDLSAVYLGDGGRLELPTSALLGSGVRPD
jgi:SAM-dependent methyltransferase